MKAYIPTTKDFWSGIVFMLLAALAIYFSSDLSMGSTRRMGPRYFPMLVSGILLIIGAIVCFRGISAEAESLQPGTFRSAFVLLAVFLFAILLRPFGFVIALSSMIIVASFAAKKMAVLEIVLLTLGLVVFAWMVFIWGLGLPMRTWPV